MFGSGTRIFLTRSRVIGVRFFGKINLAAFAMSIILLGDITYIPALSLSGIPS